MLIPATLAVLWCGSLEGNLSLLMIIVLLFANSAITEQQNAGHRLLVVVPFVAVVMAEPLAKAARFLSEKSRLLLLAFVLGFLGLRGVETWRFFSEFRATAMHDSQGTSPLYMSLRHLVEYVKKDVAWNTQTNLVIFTRPATYLEQELAPPHIQEAFNYFLPRVTVTIREAIDLPYGIIAVSTSSERSPSLTWPELAPCPTAGFFACHQSIVPIRLDPWVQASHYAPQVMGPNQQAE